MVVSRFTAIALPLLIVALRDDRPPAGVPRASQMDMRRLNAGSQARCLVCSARRHHRRTRGVWPGRQRRRWHSRPQRCRSDRNRRTETPHPVQHVGDEWLPGAGSAVHPARRLRPDQQAGRGRRGVDRVDRQQDLDDQAQGRLYLPQWREGHRRKLHRRVELWRVRPERPGQQLLLRQDRWVRGTQPGRP